MVSWIIILYKLKIWSWYIFNKFRTYSRTFPTWARAKAFVLEMLGFCFYRKLFHRLFECVDLLRKKNSVQWVSFHVYHFFLLFSLLPSQHFSSTVATTWFIRKKYQWKYLFFLVFQVSIYKFSFPISLWSLFPRFWFGIIMANFLSSSTLLRMKLALDSDGSLLFWNLAV